MYRKPHTALLALLICALLLPAKAASQEVGLFSSPKGVGVLWQGAEKNGAFNTAAAYVDIYGVVTSRCSFPGYKANFSRQYVFYRKDAGEWNLTLYAGPGLSAGYVHDHDKGRGVDLSALVADNQGFVFALSGDFGMRFEFPGAVVLNLSWTAEAGLHLRENERFKDSSNLSIYNNGFIQSLYPQLGILYRF
ncbi:MAG: hypothetical protein IJL86_00750 [Bacteroidales bacterium]|nr:hypothetical protein [Bacteroidales bacterium]